MIFLNIALLIGLMAMSFSWWREREARAEADAALLEQVQKRGAMRRSLEQTLLGAHRPPAHGAERPLLSEFAKMIHVVSLVDRTDASETVRRVVESRDGGRRRALSLTLAPAGPSRRLLVLEDAGADAAIARQRRDFVANASHELKTPIAALIGLLDLIDQVPEESRPDLLERCRRNARSLANMTEDLLGLAHAEDPDWRPTPRSTDVVALSASVVEDYQESAQAKDLVLELRAEGVEEHLLDADCYARVLRNLVANAVNYTQEGRVMVRLSGLPDGRIQVEVEDTGPGIDSTALPSIFERFFRGDPARSRATGGTGLGLAIVRNLLRRMGGRISVTSREGEGTTFRVELPVNPARPLLGAGQPEFH